MRDAYLRWSTLIWLWLEPPTVKDRRCLHRWCWRSMHWDHECSYHVNKTYG